MYHKITNLWKEQNEHILDKIILVISVTQFYHSVNPFPLDNVSVYKIHVP